MNLKITNNWKQYKLIYLDKRGNELLTKITECLNFKQALKEARILFNITSFNDLQRIRVKRIYAPLKR